MRFDVYEARDGWRWRLVARNGRIVADSGESYSSKSNAVRAAKRIAYLFYATDVEIAGDVG